MSKTINTKKTKPIKDFPADITSKLYTSTFIGLGGEVALVICFQESNFTSYELKSQNDEVVENALFAWSKTKEYEVSQRQTL